MASGVATRPIADIEAYTQQLQQFVYHSGTLMAPIHAAARKIAGAHASPEGEDEVLRAVQIAVEEARGPDSRRPARRHRARHQPRTASASTSIPHRRQSGTR